MLMKAVMIGLQEGELCPSDLYGLTDEGFVRLLDCKRHPAFGLVDSVRARRLHQQAFRTRFDQRRNEHLVIERPIGRLTAESRIREAVSSELGQEVCEHEIIIDVPESNSFATDLLVQPENGAEPIAFSRSHTVFGDDVVARFGQTLRWISVAGSRRPGLCAALMRVAPGIIGTDALRNTE